MMATGEIDYEQFIEHRRLVGALDRLLQHDGHGLDHELAGRSARHAAARFGAPFRRPIATARRWPIAPAFASSTWCKEDLKPSDILTKDNFHQRHRRQFGDRRLDQRADPHPRHRRAISASSSSSRNWQTYGHKVPLLVNLQPAGEYLGEDYYHAGGVPAVVNELMKQGLIRENAPTVNGKTIGENCRSRRPSRTTRSSAPFDNPLKKDAGFLVLARQSVRQRHHEDLGDLAGVPRALSQRPGASGHVRGQGRGVRRSGGLSPPDRRSVARDRRAHAAVHARRRPDRLSGRGRSRQHAAARLT